MVQSKRTCFGDILSFLWLKCNSFWPAFLCKKVFAEKSGRDKLQKYLSTYQTDLYFYGSTSKFM